MKVIIIIVIKNHLKHRNNQKITIDSRKTLNQKLHAEHKGECKGGSLTSGLMKGVGVVISHVTSPKMNEKRTSSVPVALKATDLLLVWECYLYSRVHLCIIYNRINRTVVRFHKTLNS